MFDVSSIIRLFDVTEDMNIWILIRHGARGQLLPGAACDETPLSQAGVVESVRMGESIGRNGLVLSGIWTSPLLRCLQTSENIVAGYGTRTGIGKVDVLAYPGSFLLECEEGRTHSSPPLEETEQVSEGTCNVLKMVVTRPATGRSIGLFVTHDAIVAPILTYLTDEEFDYYGKWVGFLDGFALVRSRDGWQVINMRGESCPVSEKVERALTARGSCPERR